MITPVSYEDRRTLLLRVAVLRGVVIAFLALLVVGYWILQVAEYQKYSEMAENNQLRTIPLRAPRGVLYDRNGKVLVQNTFSYTIAVVRERSPNPKDLSEAIRLLAAATGSDEAALADIVRRHRSETFRPVPVIEHATDEQVAAVMARRLELPEVVVQKVPTRSYEEGGVYAAHLYGYVREIDAQQLKQIEYAGLEQGAIVGQTGLERAYNSELIGKDGARKVAVNSRGREINLMAEEPPTEGARMQLTIDRDMQVALETGFKAQKFAGAAVFMDPNTGEVLAMTSQPEFNPNDFARGLDPKTWAQLNEDRLRPLTNRLLDGRYAPGSTFKIVMAAAGLAEGVIKPDTKFYCPGAATFWGRSFACHKKEGHGSIDVRHAIEKSCNVFFYNVANLLKIDTIHKYAQLLGLAGKTGIDLPGEKESIVPSEEWKRRVVKDKWYPGETISVGIGQGYLSVTPMALATMMATVANGGTRVVPHVAKAIDMGNGWKLVDRAKPKSIFPMPAEVMGPVREGLWMVVNAYGTASGARIEGFDVIGKTGTAQVIGNEAAARVKGRKTTLDLRDHAWFVFAAPRDKPEIAGVVMVEHGGHGGVSSVPIAKFVMETYFNKKMKKPLPVWKAAPTERAVPAEPATPAPAVVPPVVAASVAPSPAAGGAAARQ